MAFKAEDLPIRPVNDDQWFEGLDKVRKLVLERVEWMNFPPTIKTWVRNQRTNLQRKKNRNPTGLEIRRLDEREKAFSEYGLWDIGIKAVEAQIQHRLNANKSKIVSYVSAFVNL